MPRSLKPLAGLVRIQDVDGIETEAELQADGFSKLHDQRDRIFRSLSLVIGDWSLAAEAVDEAMARAYERWSKIGEAENPEGWVYRVGLNWSRSMLRKRGREDFWSQPPERGAFDRASDPDLRSAIGRLPVKLRSVVVARYLLDWSTVETAEALGIPESTVKTRLRRALARLAEDPGVEK